MLAENDSLYVSFSRVRCRQNYAQETAECYFVLAGEFLSSVGCHLLLELFVSKFSHYTVPGCAGCNDW